MLYYDYYLCVHAAGVCASMGEFMGVNNVTLTRYLLYCQKVHTTTLSNEQLLMKKCNRIKIEM